MATKTVKKPLTTAEIASLFGQWIVNFEGVCFVTFWKSNVDKLKYLTWERNNIYFIVSARISNPKSFDPYRINVVWPVYRTGQYIKYMNDLKALLWQLRAQLASILYGNNIPGADVTNILKSLDKLINDIKP
jgi:hypothetical protein